MDATGLALVVVALAFLCWLLAPSHRAESDTDAPQGQDNQVAAARPPAALK
ncbi:MAG TPA: hypothetical protein VM287_12730 [Egibacteraceae bacterium]|nr:hypothetical protein [Egibacteraceae bacterium]